MTTIWAGGGSELAYTNVCFFFSIWHPRTSLGEIGTIGIWKLLDDYNNKKNTYWRRVFPEFAFDNSSYNKMQKKTDYRNISPALVVGRGVRIQRKFAIWFLETVRIGNTYVRQEAAAFSTTRFAESDTNPSAVPARISRQVGFCVFVWEL